MTNNNSVAEGYKHQTVQAETDYSILLQQYGIQFTVEDFYLVCGPPAEGYDWHIHLSVVVQQLAEMLSLVLPQLKQAQVPFRLASSKEIAIEIQAGHLGLYEIGKILTVYVKENSQALALVTNLREQLKGFYGPAVLNAAHVDGVIYAEYGTPSSMPIELPKGVQWPFRSIKPFTKSDRPSVLNGKYKITHTIKEDAKGFVWGGVFLRNLVKATPCVIKEGRGYMMHDDYGRDVGDRITWQLKLHKDLLDVVSLPKVYDCFRENGNTYLVLEYIDGLQLDLVITEIFQQRTWQDLSATERLRLINFGIQVVDNISAMHRVGFVHRDITSGNFLVTPNDTIVLIDLELAYSLNEQQPIPPFITGTDGFMSPEQVAMLTPTVKEDIYAIGATLMVLFTGILPTKFETCDTEIMNEQLSFFIQDQALAGIIINSLSSSAVNRPTLAEIKSALEELRQGILYPKVTEGRRLAKGHSIPNGRELVQQAINTLASPLFCSPERLWYSKAKQNPSANYAQVTVRAIYGGLHSGQSGVLYLLAKAKQNGLDIKPCIAAYYKALGFLQECYLKDPENVSGGLFHGTAGIGLAAAEGIKSGLLASSPAAIQNVEACFSSQNIYGFGLDSGAAGQGIAILQSLNLITRSFGERRLQGLVTFLVEHQQKDGSWTSGKEKLFGFDKGVAGITYFLLAFHLRFPDRKVEQAALKALGWLEQQINSKSEKNCALIYLKAYKILERQQYLHLAGEIFNNLPERISTRDLGQAGGLAGLGELYLEAYDILKSQQFRQRADWIAEVLLHEYRQENSENVYWQVDESSGTTADFMTGNAGVLHFLLRWLHPDKLSHPILI